MNNDKGKPFGVMNYKKGKLKVQNVDSAMVIEYHVNKNRLYMNLLTWGGMREGRGNYG